MPPITLHMVLANRIAEGLEYADIDGSLGEYFLGATSPDIRVLTRQGREETHFFDLDEYGHQDSVAGFFEAYEHLVDPSRLAPKTRAFVAGYVSHLVFDEHYITRIYRPFFARYEDLGGHLRANLMDRLLQFDLDREFGDDPGIVHRLASALACTVDGIECGFIDHQTLDKWREVSLDVAQKNMDLPRMRSMVSNHLRRAGIQEDRELGEMLDSIPDLLNETIAHVTSDEIDAFLRRSTEAAAAAIERYFNADFPQR
jgi:hypothetical protein